MLLVEFETSVRPAAIAAVATIVVPFITKQISDLLLADSRAVCEVLLRKTHRLLASLPGNGSFEGRRGCEVSARAAPSLVFDRRHEAVCCVVDHSRSVNSEGLYFSHLQGIGRLIINHLGRDTKVGLLLLLGHHGELVVRQA